MNKLYKVSIRVILAMVKEMEWEDFYINREDILKENGKIIPCKVMENCFIPMKKQHIKEIGKIINSMDKVKSSTILPIKWQSNNQ